MHLRYLLKIFTPLIFILFSFTIYLGKEEYKEFKLSGYAQGTTYSITYYGEKEQIKAAQIDSILDVIDESMSLYKENSLINQFNFSDQGVLLDKHFKKIIEKSLEVYQASGGYFDITVEPLVQAWGFGAVKIDTLPSENSILEIKKHIGSDKLKLKGDYLTKADKSLKIDVNGIAQGYSVDVLGEFLESKSIENYLVELGGEIRVRGGKFPGGKEFSIGIESPSNALTEVPMRKILKLRSGALTTSGNYRKFYTKDKKRISHLIDPKTGYPLQNDMISVTVYANDAVTADGFDNVFMSMGVKESLKFLKRHRNMEAYFIYQKKDGIVADTASAGFYKFIDHKTIEHD